MTSPIWHPFTQHALRLSLPVAVHAEGAYITTEDEDRVLDAISSWWVVTHGHRHPRIVAAIKAQVEALDQVIFAEFTREPAESLARELVAIAPKGLQHVFFSGSGSTSVEVALKMALGFWRHTADVFSFEFVHGESDCLRRGGGEYSLLGRGAGTGADRGAHGGTGETTGQIS